MHEHDQSVELQESIEAKSKRQRQESHFKMKQDEKSLVENFYFIASCSEVKSE